MGLTNFEAFGDKTQLIVKELGSPQFLEFAERLTGIGNLLADPDLDGGGLHRDIAERLSERPRRLSVAYDEPTMEPATQFALISE